MRVPLRQPRPRRWLAALRLPPALFAAAAVFVIAYTSLGQANNAAGAGGDNPATAPAASADAQSGDGAAPAAAPKKDPSLWELYVKGGPTMWVLTACSVLAVAIIFERLFALRRAQVIPPGFVPGFKAVFRDPRYDRERALQYCQANDSPMSRMVAAWVKRLPRGFLAAEKALEDAGGNEALKLRLNMRLLYSIGSVATLLGLVGTIAGMIKAFMVTARLGDAANKVEALSTGIYEAMVCTFGGLAVAIVVTVFYYYFVGRIEKLVGEINDELTTFANEYGLNAESDGEVAVTAQLEGVR